MKVDFVCNTDGYGLWTCRARGVKVIELVCDNQELCAYFDTVNWDIKKDGLIYTDELWMDQFKEQLLMLGFTNEAVESVDYSEQGMQGSNYVSMDVSPLFEKEFGVISELSVFKIHIDDVKDKPQIKSKDIPLPTISLRS